MIAMLDLSYWEEYRLRVFENRML